MDALHEIRQPGIRSASEVHFHAYDHWPFIRQRDWKLNSQVSDSVDEARNDNKSDGSVANHENTAQKGDIGE